MVISAAAALGISAVSLSIVLSPGPNMIYLASRSVTQGRRAGLVSLLGVAAGFFVYLALTVAGLTTIFIAVPATFLALKVAGAAYLLYLAVNALRPGAQSVFAPGELPPDPPRRLFLMGLVTNLLNPKIAVLYVALLPQFIDPAKDWIALQSLSLGLVQIAVAVTVNALIVLFAGSLSSFLTTRPTWLRVQKLTMGGVLAALAVSLLVTPST